MSNVFKHCIGRGPVDKQHKCQWGTLKVYALGQINNFPIVTLYLFRKFYLLKAHQLWCDPSNQRKRAPQQKLLARGFLLQVSAYSEQPSLPFRSYFIP